MTTISTCRYIDSRVPEDEQNIEAHLNGGIPMADVGAFEAWRDVCPGLRAALFKPNRAGYVDLAVDKSAIKSAIHQHPQFAAFVARMNGHFEDWRKRESTALKALNPGFHPKELIAELSEDLLAHYTGQPLMDAYAVYQHLMDYWAEIMQDDAYMITVDGWRTKPYRIVQKDKKGKEKARGWACDLVPKALVVARYFINEQTAIDQYAADLETAEAQLSELEEEHGGEDAAFGGFDKISAKTVKERLDEIVQLSSLRTPRRSDPESSSFGDAPADRYRRRSRPVASVAETA
jgi:type I restriction enzyme M protein